MTDPGPGSLMGHPNEWVTSKVEDIQPGDQIRFSGVVYRVSGIKATPAYVYLTVAPIKDEYGFALPPGATLPCLPKET